MEFIEGIQYEANQFILSLPHGLNMSIRKLLTSAAAFSGTVLSQSAAGVEDLDGPGKDLYEKDLSACPGYIATNQHETDLSLAGEACNVFGTDLPDLKLEVEYQTSERLHVKIKDSNNTVYQASTAIVTKRTVANCRPGPR
jgi:alpha-glucosidase